MGVYPVNPVILINLYSRQSELSGGKNSGCQFSKPGVFRGIMTVVFQVEFARRAVHSFQKTGPLMEYCFEILLKIRPEEHQNIMSGQPGIHRGKP